MTKNASETHYEHHKRLLGPHTHNAAMCWCNPQAVTFYDCETGEPGEPTLAHDLGAEPPTPAQACPDLEAAWETWASVPYGPMWSLDPEDFAEMSFKAGYESGLAAKGLDA